MSDFFYRVCFSVFFMLPVLNGMCQEDRWRFFMEASPNYTFAKVEQDDPVLNARVNSLPLFGFGVGTMKRFDRGLFIDGSLKLHFRNYRSSISVFEIQANSSTVTPLLSVNAGGMFGQSKVKWFGAIGGSAGYLTDAYIITTFTDRDTTARRRVDIEDEIFETITSFLNVSSGVFISGKRRNYMFSLSYSHGFQKPYSTTYTYVEKQVVRRARITGRESFVQLQFRWFLKNKE